MPQVFMWTIVHEWWKKIINSCESDKQLIII